MQIISDLLSFANPGLSKLRTDIKIFEGGADKYNSPTWVIHDPLIDKFYRIGWTEYEVINNWHLGDAESICTKVNNTTVLTINANNVARVKLFLETNNLIDFGSNGVDDKLYQEYTMFKGNKFQKILKEYLFFKIPIVHPDKFLSMMMPYVKALFDRRVLYVFLVMGAIGLYFVTRQWSRFISTYDYFFTFENLILLFCILTVTKIMHELGHAFTAKYFNCKVSSMGVAFLVLFPVLYTDTTDSWRLKKRYQRVAIASAGMVTEFAICAVALFLWGLIPDGPLSSVLVYIPTVSLVMTLLINANPLLRFDGYHILADVLSTDNLQTKSFSLASWKLRQVVLGLDEAQPVICSNNDKKLYLIYAYFTWVYRFFLYLGIAVLVYYFFFKVLGIFLMLVELYYFIFKPIIGEVSTSYIKMKNLDKIPGRAKISFILFILFLLILFIPWQTRVEIPAVLTYENDAKIYSQLHGQVNDVLVNRGDVVKTNQILLKLSSPEVSYQLKKVEKEIDMIQTKLRQQAGKGTVLGEKQVSVAELIEKQNERSNLLDEQNKLIVRAPYAGEVLDKSKSLKLNSWIKNADYLLSIADINSHIVVGYIQEQDLARLPKNIAQIKAKFYYKNLSDAPYNVKIVKVEHTGQEFLANPYFASIYGGDVLVFQNKNPETKRSRESEELVIGQSLYKILATPSDKMINEKKYYNYSVRGYLQLDVESRSLAGRFFRNAASILIREMGL